MKLKDGLYVIPGYDGAATGGNVAVRVTTEGVIVVDSKLPVLYADIVNKVKSVSARPIKYLLNTHQHGDHTGSNAQFLKTTEILMHRNARANMIKANLPGPGRIVYTDQQSVFLGGVEAQMRYMGRGHTNGDSVIYFPDLRTVHTGDLVVWGKRSQGTTLTPNMDYAAGSGSGKEWVATLDKMLALDFDTAIPGHGPVLTKDQVRVFRNKMQTLNERMAALIKGGGKKTDIATKIRLDDLDWPFQPNALDGLFDELSKP
jgi:glyoxylase-like metal-dependent hydrolase (beta-lactamase superfamily II)